MQGAGRLRELLDKVVARTLVDKGFKQRLDILSPEARADDLKRIAQGFEIDPGIIDDFDLAGIETDSFQGFLEQVHFRFFEDSLPGPER
jgi:hypothetical protein